MRSVAVLVWSLSASALCQAQEALELRNWFNDPFFQVSSAIRDCPVPAGPFITEAERRVQAHHRAELGTTCWLAGSCDQPSYYAYDDGIAKALQAALAQQNPFSNTTLWVTVQGRIVFIEGCVDGSEVTAQIEAFVRTVPNVQQAVAIVYSGGAEHSPYRLLTPVQLNR